MYCNIDINSPYFQKALPQAQGILTIIVKTSSQWLKKNIRSFFNEIYTIKAATDKMLQTSGINKKRLIKKPNNLHNKLFIIQKYAVC